MKASEIGEDQLIQEAADLIAADVAVGLLDPAQGSTTVGAVTDRGVFETLLMFSPDGDLVIPLSPESGLVALEVTPNEGGLASLGTLLDKKVLPTKTPIVSTAGEEKSYLFFRFDGPRTKPCVTLGAGLELIADGFVVAPPRHAPGTEGQWKQGYHPADMPVTDLPAKFAALL